MLTYLQAFASLVFDWSRVWSNLNACPCSGLFPVPDVSTPFFFLCYYSATLYVMDQMSSVVCLGFDDSLVLIKG